MKKMSRFLSILALALSAAALPRSGFAADGDIVDIRAVDTEAMAFGTRNVSSLVRCTMENPLIAGDEIYIRVRMLVRNYKKIHTSPYEDPKEWAFKPNTTSASILNTPALGLFIGDRPVYATFSETGPNWWQRSGTLRCDDAGATEPVSKTTDYTHFTDLYFHYKVQAGDIGLPVVLMNSNRAKASSTDDNTDYFLLNCAMTAGDNLSPWKLVNTEDTPAVFHYGAETLEAPWPTGGLTAGPVRNFDLAAEGVFIKTVDFDRVNAAGEPWTEGDVWRNVYPGMTDAPMTLPALSIPGGSKTEEANVVWIWSEDESVFEPVGNGIQMIDGHKKLPVTIPAGAETVTFTLKGADGAAVGSVANIVMSSSRTRIVTPAGEEIGSTLKRLVQVVTPPEPTVKIFLDGTEPKKKVTATPDYTTCGTKLTLRMVPTCSEDVTVTLKASVEGDSAMGSLEEIYEENIIRIAPDNYGGDPINQRITAVTIPAGTSTVNFDVFILGATAKTGNKGVYFETEKNSGPASVKTEGGCTLQIARGTPVIVDSEPPFLETEDDKTTITVKTGDTVDFTLELADTYRNLNDEETGYTFYWTCDSQGDIDPYDGVVMEDGLFTGSAEFYNVTGAEGDILSLYVKSPDGQKSKAVTYRLIVNDKPTTTIEFTEPRMTFCEGEQAYVSLGLWPTAYRKTGYIFLDADDKSKLGYVDSELKTDGALLPQGQLKVETPRLIRFRDGTKDLTLKAVLCSENDLSKPVTTYASGTLSFTVTNKPPAVVSVMAAGQYVTPDMGGKTLPDPISRGVVKTFTVVVDDVEDDLKATGDNAMSVKWMIDGTTYETNSIDNAGFAVKHTFANEKENALVQIFVKDKDMLDYPQVPNLSFYARIKDTPRVLIRTSAIGGKFLETDKSVSTITVELTEPATAPVKLRFKVSQVKDGGYLKIRTVEGSVEEATDEAGKVLPGEYDLFFDSGVLTKELVVSEMDGTNETLGGLDLNARVTSGELNPDGVAWSNFYTKAEAGLIRVQNVAPEIIRPTEAEAAYTNENASANVPYPIPYGCSDVAADLATGVVVQVSIDGTVVFTTNATSTAVGSYEATFEGEGAHVVEVAFTDKDQMIARRTLNYFVKPSKRLQLRAHGPAGALGTTGGYSMHYGAASGLGAGRVYAGEKGPQQVKNFVHLYSFAEVETAISAYAVGYQVGDIDKGDLEPFNDAAIDVDGNTYDAAKGKGHYDYTNDVTYASAGFLGFDSFLYGWACNNTESSNSQSQNPGGGTTETTMSFLLNIGQFGETVIPLPATDGKNDNSKTTAYPMQYWEAVFSRELFKPDNCGDINLDGVPDIAVYRFGLGIVNTATYQLIAGGEGSGNTEGDLTDVSGFNKDVDKDGADDPDYLPTTETAAYPSYIPGLKGTWVSVGQPFGARLEIRGYHDGLNDALDQLGITGYRPTRIYAEEVKDAEGATQWKWTANCTISELEFLAWCEFAARTWPDDPDAWTKAENWIKWSPERPTNPMKSDTDGDGFTDGYEYYFWYKAHVGYIDANGVHRYLTGRRYDERNPGEGTLITSEEIADLMDPLMKSGDASNADLRDTDNDGLPDLLEFEIGTNPFDFDTDGDGLPDGWELCNVGNLDPLDPASHLDGKSDTVRNSDGDAMAITSWKLEKNVYPAPFEGADKARGQFTTFAVIKADGMTDAVQWYAVRCAPEDVKVETTTNEEDPAWSFTADGRTFVTRTEPVKTADGRLAVTLAKEKTFVATNLEEGVALALYPVRLAAGLPITDVAETKMAVTTLATNIAAKDANACWIYGRGTARTEYGEVAETAADYGCLALGGQLEATAGLPVCALPDNTRDVAFLHYLVYQEFGFDPRTAWKEKDPLNIRWGKTEGGEAEEGIVMLRQGGYAGKPARTRDYSNYDEFLVYSFFLNNGCDMKGVTRITDLSAYAQIVTWDMFTTNPQGPDEKLPPTTEGGTGGETAVTVKSYGRGTNGADTDGDGVPDGWELYVMAGPKTAKGEFVFAPPYAGFVTALSGEEKMPESYFSPFRAFAQGVETSNQIYLGGEANDDGLNQYQEFEGTDSIGYYAQVQTGNTSAYSTTIKHVEAWTWFNKFFPTDPWSFDTDGDTLSDAAERGVFNYGDVDIGKTCIPGGGLNPCSTDTDLDGLPDPWEAQYKGKTVYTGAKCQFAEGVDADGAAKTSTKATLQGYMDGMDGTVADAFSHPVKFEAGADGSSSNVATYVQLNGVNEVVNRDYDHDGLENWQEYLTGTMRCWRYDDPISSWQSIPSDWYFTYNEASGMYDWLPQYEKFGLDPEADDVEDQFWYMTLVDTSSRWYNPHLVVDQNPSAQYFTRVTNGWDGAYTDAGLSGGKQAGAYYYIYNRCVGGKIEDVWVKNGPLALMSTGRTSPSKYIGCSPIDEDSDHDGMDDYYELFHGLNPLLGQEGVLLSDGGPCDLVFDAWQLENEGLWAWGSGATANYWQGMRKHLARGTGFDFEVFPWLNGRQESDPDGDDVKNVEESIMARLEPETVWHHTDPTPLWMTDSTYSNSLVRQYFQMQAGLANAYPANFTFKHTNAATGETTVYSFRDFDGYMEAKDMMNRPIPVLGVFAADFWSVSSADTINWMYSFEENEGFDSDHDGLSDHEEIESKFRSATEPQDADSPRRRQAMYFQGPARPSALQTPPFVHEDHPVGVTGYPADPSFLQYTVECWVMPESLADATIIERAVYSGATNPGDEEYMRCNFQLAVKNGKWYTKFDPNGTVRGNQVEIFSDKAASVGTWTHLAATYDGKYLRFYVNGEAEIPAESGLAPAYGSNAIALQKDSAFWFDREHPLHSILVGASFKTNGDGMRDGNALDLTLGLGWSRYKDFFTGYVDEIRIWDGARRADEIEKAMNIRFGAAEAKQNRNDFYDAWSQGKYRYADDGQGSSATVPAELRFHWAFDSVFGAENEREVAKAPHGFDVGKAPLSRPDGYGIAWWMDVLAGYTGTVYSNPAWVTWIPNTVTHLPRFDGTTLDSFYWSDDFKGDESGKWTFTKVAEPVSRWTQVLRNGVTTSRDYRSTDTRHRFVNEYDATGSKFARLYEFTGRNLNKMGDDLLPLGGAYVKYVPNDPGLWDKQGASTTWEITGADADGDGLPNWWETYAEQNYREGLDQSKKIDWNSDVNYRGVIMKAGTAYLRDLAKGIYVDADGKLHSDLPTQFAQTADEDRNGIPDWWEDMYGIRGEAGLADHDNDGLPNYVEYLLSEVFDFNVLFSPVNPRSVNPTAPDYFYRVGELYVGEIFTDHDLVDDSWEDVYPASFASRLAWDADADADEDGWSNRSENRYSKAVMPIIADQRTHYTAADGLVADYPIPTLALKLRYNGNRQQTVLEAPVAVQVTTDEKLVRDPDAVFMIGAGEKMPGDTGTDTKKDDKSETASAEMTKTRTIGKWSNRHAIGTLTPGNIKQNSLALEFCYDPSSVMYSWRTLDHLPNGAMRWTDKRGTRLEYDTDKRKYGEENVELLAADTSYAQLKDLEIRAGEDSSTAIWIHTKSGQELGKVNLVTGEFDLNLGVFAGQYVENGTNAADYVSLEDQTFRIAYTANPSVGLPRELYLGAADKGFVREGRNTIIAWAETVAADGVWQVGEPYGIVRNVDISWRGTTAEIELTDASPVTPRIDLVADDAMPRVTRADIRERIEAHPDLNTPTILKWLDGNPIADRAAEGESFRGQRVRVVRWMINDVPVFLANADAKVVLDKTVETDVRGCLTEADFLVGNESFDIDWDDLSGILDEVREACGVVTNVSYLVVVGDGDVDWNDFDASNTVYALNTVITRKFGRTRVKPVAVSPGVTDSGIVHSANPTFKWTMACPEDEGYTAFNVQVMDGTTLIYDSGKQLAPPRNSKGEYEWSAPLYVGDKNLVNEKGQVVERVFENKTVYTWKVSMYNAKFSNTAVYSDAGKFRMEVQTNATSCGTANVAVRYFGPSESYTKKTPVVRVQAFTSPDFTGRPVAAGFVEDMTTLATADREVTANCHVIGLESGSYYLQAFIDSNGNGVCDRWETQGYLCARDGSTADWLNPTAITFDTAVGPGDLAVIYLEDADTDGDGLPDAWEWANASDAGRANGTFLDEKDVEELSETKAGEFVVNAALSGAMKLQENALAPTAGLAGRLAGSGLMANAGVLALAMGAPTEGYDSFAAAIRGYVSPELVEDGVRISSLDLVDDKVSIKVEAETETAGSAWVKGRTDLTVWCQVQWKPSLTGTDWLPLGDPFEITVGTETAEEIDISDRVPDGDSGYFSVKLYKK